MQEEKEGLSSVCCQGLGPQAPQGLGWCIRDLVGAYRG